MNYFQFESSIGVVVFMWNADGRLTRILLSHAEDKDGILVRGMLHGRRQLPPRLFKLFDHFNSYFENGVPLGDVPWEAIESSAWTDFQRRVYQEAALIPHGETRTYAWIAERMGTMGATRAVGQALRKNPLPILIPCHRIISTQGGLGGFMGTDDPNQPELKMKKSLIALEYRYRNPLLPFMVDHRSDSRGDVA